MKTIIVDEQEYNLPTGWDELYWKGYVEMIKLEEQKEKYLSPFLYTQRFIEILCGVEDGVFDVMELETLAELEQKIVSGFNPDLLKDIQATVDHFEINGITYSFYSPNTINKITIGEQGYIEMTKQQSTNDWDFITRQLAVLIRPAILVTSKEGQTKWKLDRFNPDEVEHRIKILEANLSVKTLIMIHNFFLNGASI